MENSAKMNFCNCEQFFNFFFKIRQNWEFRPLKVSFFLRISVHSFRGKFIFENIDIHTHIHTQDSNAHRTRMCAFFVLYTHNVLFSTFRFSSPNIVLYFPFGKKLDTAAVARTRAPFTLFDWNMHRLICSNDSSPGALRIVKIIANSKPFDYSCRLLKAFKRVWLFHALRKKCWKSQYAYVCVFVGVHAYSYISIGLSAMCVYGSMSICMCVYVCWLTCRLLQVHSAWTTLALLQPRPFIAFRNISADAFALKSGFAQIDGRGAICSR